MKVSIIGTGYVGLVTGACLADVGNDVLCLDVDERKIDMLRARRDPDLRARAEGGRAQQRRARGGSPSPPTRRKARATPKVQMIAVGTPPGEDGSADLQYVLAAARSIAQPHGRATA